MYMTETKCGAFEEVKKLEERFDRFEDRFRKDYGPDSERAKNIKQNSQEINKIINLPYGAIGKNFTRIDKYKKTSKALKDHIDENKKQVNGTIYQLARILDSMRNAQHGGKRKTRVKKSKRKKKRKTKKRKKRNKKRKTKKKTKKRFRNQRGCKR
jgi:hypothetical protein